MELYSQDIINELFSNERVGAGNFVRNLLLLAPNTDKPSLILDESTHLPFFEHKSLSLQQINDYSSQLSQWYQLHGTEPKDPVALFFDDSILYFLHYVALTNIGAIPVFLNGGLSHDIVCRFVNSVGAVRLMTQKSRLDAIRQMHQECGCSVPLASVEAMSLSGLPGNYKVFAHQPDDPVLLGHTSGTTGLPKAVQFNHEGFIFGVKQQIHKQVGTRILSALPHSHASALSILMSGLLRGALIKVQTRKSPMEIISGIEKFRPDLFVSFPKIYVDLCRVDLSQFDLSSIAYWLSTGDANHEPHIRKLISYGSYMANGVKKKGSLFIDNLGSSEFGFAAFRNIHKPSDNNYDRCIGRPFDWVKADVLAENGTSLQPNQIGLLGVKSKSVTAGYWNNSLLTEKNKLAGYWLTGDLAYKDDDGVFFHVDRVSDPIETPGGTLYSCQAEELVLKNFPEVYDCSIVGVTDGSGATYPIITVELLSMTDADSLLDRINVLFRSIQLPVVVRLSMETTESYEGVTGKMLKRVMREELTVA